jgi:DNA-binding NarL/FixJ family response regulator
MPKTRVVIAEDHAVVRQGLRILIHTDPDLQVTGEAADGPAAVELAEKMRPDIVIMDLAMPRMNGLEATRAILQKAPGSKVLVLSSYSDDDSVASLLGAGASGYITKHSASDDLLQAIRQIIRGKQYLSPRISQRLRRRNQSAFLHGRQPTRELSPREKEVLKLIALGLASKEIAARLALSSKTIEKHRQAVMDKLDIHDIAGLTRYAAGKGLLPDARGASLSPNSGPAI